MSWSLNEQVGVVMAQIIRVLAWLLSLVEPDYGISVAAVYHFSEDKGIYKVGGGVSLTDADA